MKLLAQEILLRGGGGQDNAWNGHQRRVHLDLFQNLPAIFPGQIQIEQIQIEQDQIEQDQIQAKNVGAPPRGSEKPIASRGASEFGRQNTATINQY